MVIFIDNQGTVTASVPSALYQDGETGRLVIICPFASSMSGIISFELPSGILTQDYSLTYRRNIELKNSQGLVQYQGYAWTVDLPSEVTAHYGTVNAQIKFIFANGKKLSTSAQLFTVGKGVPSILPEEPTANIYESILSALSSIRSDMQNGLYPSNGLFSWRSVVDEQGDTVGYSLGEIVLYRLTDGSLAWVQSLVDSNTEEPYENGVIKAPYWRYLGRLTLPEGYVTREEYNVTTAQLQAQIGAIDTKADNNAEDIGELGDRLGDVEATLENHDERITDNTSSITALEVEHTAIREDIEEAQRGVEEIQELIPSTASVDNPLTTESEVIQLVQENRAYFRGNYDTWEEVPRTITGYPQDTTGSKTPTVNDYMFIRDASSYGADYSGTWRFAYTGTWAELGANGWKPEYEYQSQPFTDEQWAALNSGATAELIASITQKREYVGLTLAYRGGNHVVVSADGETTYTLNSLYTLLQDKTKDVHIVVNVSNDHYIPVYVYSSSIIFFTSSYSGINSQCSYIEVSVDNTATVHFITNETTDNKISEITDDDEEDEEKYTSATAVVKYLYPVEDTGDEVYTLEMHPNKTYIIETPVKSLNLEFGDIAEYHIQFITADSGDDTYELPEIIFSREIIWANGERPSFSWGTRYEISILGDCGVYQEFYAEEEE